MGVGCLCYIVITALFYFFQEKMLFFPSGPAFGRCPQMDRYGARAVESGAVRYYLKENPAAVNWIIVFHGNAGNACGRTYFFDLFDGECSNIVICEYPGYGQDKKRPGEAEIRRAALALITHVKGLPAGRLPVYLAGESLGTGVATWAATQAEVSGLILISAYTTISKVARHHYPWLPVTALLKHPFPAETWAAACDTPALLFHGKADEIIPVKFAREQARQFKGDVRLVEIENCGHNDIVDTGRRIIRENIREFINPVFPRHCIKNPEKG